MKPIININILLLGLLLPGISWGQAVIDGYVALALKQNQGLLQQQNMLRQQEAHTNEATGLFFPQVSMVANYTMASGGRQIDFPVGDMLNPVYATLNQLTESQQFPTNVDNVEIQFLPNKFQETKLRLIQPLFNSDIYYNLKAQQNLLDVQDARVKAYELELVFKVKSAYYNYVQSHEALVIYENTLSTLKQLLETNRKQVAQGIQSAETVYRTQTEIAQLKSQLETAIEQETNARMYFNFLLNKPIDSPIELDDHVSLSPIDSVSHSSRPELQMIQAAQLAQANEASRLSAQRLPNLNLVVDAGYQGFGYDLKNQEFVLMQVGLQWNLFSGFTRKSQQAASTLQLENLQLQENQIKQQIEFEIGQAYAQYHRALAQWQLQSQAVENAEKTLDIMKHKYEQGQVLLIELIDAQNTYLSEQKSLNLSTYQIPIAVAAIERALAY